MISMALMGCSDANVTISGLLKSLSNKGLTSSTNLQGMPISSLSDGSITITAQGSAKSQTILKGSNGLTLVVEAVR